MARLLMLFAILASFPAVCNAELFPLPLVFSHIGAADGLSQSSVYALLQDRLGYVWIATGDGLNRYDGHEIVTYRHDPADPRSLSDNYISTLALADDGTIWAGTLGGGLNRLDPATGRVTRFRHVPGGPGTLPGDDIHALLVDGDTLWVGTDAGLARFSPAEGRAEPVNLRHRTKTIPIQALKKDRAGNLWIGTDGYGVFIRRPGAPAAAPVYTGLPPLPTGEQPAVSGIHQDGAGTIWLATGGGLVRLDAEGEEPWTATRYRHIPGYSDSVPSDIVTAVIDGNGPGHLWVATWGGGLSDFDTSTGTFTSYTRNPADRDSIASNAVISLYRDASGTVWAGTLEQGLSLFRESPLFEHYHQVQRQSAALPSDTIWGFAERDDGTVWVGTAAGAALFSPASRSVQPLGGEEALGHDTRAMAQTPGALWIGTWGKGLYRRDEATGQSSRIAGLLDQRIRLLLAGTGGMLWIGTQQGLNRLELATGAVTPFTAVPGSATALPHNRLRALHQDRNGRLWVGTSGGLSRLEPNGTFTTWTNRPGDPASLGDNDIRAIHEDAAGILWLATGNGLTRFDPATGRGRTFRESDGLANNTLYGIMPDDGGRLWITTNHGLSVFDPADGRFRTFTIDDGLQDNEFNFGAWLRLADGRMLAGGSRGFNLFTPARVLEPPPPALAPVLRVQDITIRSDGRTRTVPADAVTATATADRVAPQELTYRDDEILIRFAGIQFDARSAVSYRVWLEGLDRSWGPWTRGLRQLRYTALPPGRYTVHVRAIGARGLESPDELRIPLLVRPAPWLTPWAFAAYGLIVLTLVSSAHMLRNRAIAARAARLEAEVARQTEALAGSARAIEAKNAELRGLLDFRDRLYEALSHELRTPLSVVLSALQTLETPSPSASRADAATVGAALSSARRLERMIGRLLQLARAPSPPPPAPHTTLDMGAVVNGATAALRMLAQDRGLILEATVSAGLAVEADGDALDQIVQNLVSNAIKYTPPGGWVRVSLTQQDGWAVFRVDDSGVGIPAAEQPLVFQRLFRGDGDFVRSQPGSGIGLSLVAEQTARLHGRIVLDSHPGQGTSVTVHLPLSAHLPVAPERRTPPPGPVLTGRIVLIVDDDPDLRSWLPHLFEPANQCHLAATAEEGLALAREMVPDAVLCDVMLPGASGFDFARALRSDTLTSHIPLILLTALADDDSRLNGLEQGIDDYITKPFDNHELLLRIRNLLDNRERASRRQGKALTPDTPPPLPASAGDEAGDEAGDAGGDGDGVAAAGHPVPETDLAETAGEESAPPAADTGGTAPDTDTPADEPYTPGDRRDRQFLDRVDRLLLERMGEQSIKLSDIAAACGFGERQFQRKFTAVIDVSFPEYRQALRMREARRLLLADMPLTRVAETLGFSSQAYFTKTFRDAHGIPPGQWRARQQARTPGARPAETVADGQA